MRHRQQAICVRASDFSETSQVVHFLTRSQGLVRLIAKGTKRPKSKTGGMIDLLAEGDLVYSATGRDALGTLMEFSETVSHNALRRQRQRLNVALYMIELAGDMVAEGDVHVEVFDLLHSALARLGQDDAPAPAVLAYFQWRMLHHVGLLGDLTVCVGCGEEITAPGTRHSSPVRSSGPGSLVPGAVYFTSIQGGLLCQSCEGAHAEKFRLDAAALKGLAVLQEVRTGKRLPLDDAPAQALNRLLAYHIQHQLGKRLRLARHAIT